ncbi:MAG TPA: SDR family oxidoreductase [Candidatus Saccharimonadia bacterium]|nr:SDR family oxidoreductase [Candidatus Saccharimonadia bacterium]
MKHALVTGASSGIGKAVAEALLQDSWSVLGTSRRKPAIEHERFSWIGTDLVSKYQAGRIGNAYKFGHPLDALVHCAATYGPEGWVGDVDAEDWVRTITVNLEATFHVVQSVLPYLLKSEDGRILLFSGGGAFGPYAGRSAYAASKAGVVSLMETMAEEQARVSVNCVAPGYVPTPMTGHLDAPSPEKDRAVACVLRLLSSETKGLTGKTISAEHDDWSRINQENVESLNDSLLGQRHRYKLIIPAPPLVPPEWQARTGMLV